MYHLLACILHTTVLNTDPNSCPPEVKPRPMKTIHRPTNTCTSHQASARAIHLVSTSGTERLPILLTAANSSHIVVSSQEVCLLSNVLGQLYSMDENHVAMALGT